ncbi:MAG TPA: hypothetical protein VFB58_16795 [Chloroflexota bacterium]|nr:hypothetical protein [Chloroflexota bacterium]
MHAILGGLLLLWVFSLLWKLTVEACRWVKRAVAALAVPAAIVAGASLLGVIVAAAGGGTSNAQGVGVLVFLAVSVIALVGRSVLPVLPAGAPPRPVPATRPAPTMSAGRVAIRGGTVPAADVERYLRGSLQLDDLSADLEEARGRGASPAAAARSQGTPRLDAAEAYLWVARVFFTVAQGLYDAAHAGDRGVMPAAAHEVALTLLRRTGDLLSTASALVHAPDPRAIKALPVAFPALPAMPQPQTAAYLRGLLQAAQDLSILLLPAGGMNRVPGPGTDAAFDAAQARAQMAIQLAENLIPAGNEAFDAPTAADAEARLWEALRIYLTLGQRVAMPALDADISRV